MSPLKLSHPYDLARQTIFNLGRRLGCRECDPVLRSDRDCPIFCKLGDRHDAAFDLDE